MTHRILSVLLLFSLALTLSGSAVAQEPAGEEDRALVLVEVAAAGELDRFAGTGLPAYARLQHALLTGADAAGLALLGQAGLNYRILDADMRGATYYLASAAPGRAIEWSRYGQVLLEDDQVLLRMTAQQAESLSLAGAGLRLLTLDPKPLRPVAAPFTFPQDVEPDEQIQDMIEQVDSTTVDNYTAGLTGDQQVWVDDAWYTIPTRYTYSGTPIQKATSWTGEHFENLGLDVEYHQWNAATNPNVIGELPGLVNPEEIFIIGGHLDDVVGTPGADDNASGSVATMIAADILTQYQWGCTLRFALWTGEEQGLYGSQVYAQRSYNMGENIAGYLNLDMISYNTIDSSPDIDLIYNPNMQPTLELAQLFEDVVSAYNLNLVPQKLSSLGGGSDHQSFWTYGYTAILGIEDQGDFNPYYHGSGDTRAHQSLIYYTEFVKAAVGTFAHMTNCLYLDHEVDLSGDEAQTGIPGETLTYTLSVTNTGTLTDTYDVSLAASVFPAQADATQVGPLVPGATAIFNVMVTIPGSALPGAQDAVEVTVTSQGNAGISDSATLTTTVGGSYGVDLGADQTEGFAPPGGVVTYTFSLTNTGSLQDTILLTTTGVDQGWEVQLAQDSFDLAGGERVESSLQVFVPAGAATSDWDSFTLRATSLHDPSIQDELVFTTAASEDCIPVGDVDFTYSPFDPEAGDVMTFVASSTGTPPFHYAWDFGDGESAEGEQVIHIYETGGTYLVTLTASNACGEQSTTQEVTIGHEVQIFLPVIAGEDPQQ